MILVISQKAFGFTSTTMTYALSLKKYHSRIGSLRIHESCRKCCLSRQLPAMLPCRDSTTATDVELRFSVATGRKFNREVVSCSHLSSTGERFTSPQINSYGSRINRSMLDSSTSTAVSIYSNYVDLTNPFDSDTQRAFSHVGSQIAHFSTSSALYTSRFKSLPEDSYGARLNQPRKQPDQKIEPIQIYLTQEEEELFDLLRTVTRQCGMKSTLRVAGGWVRDKILESKEFKRDNYFFQTTVESRETEAVMKNTPKFMVDDTALAVNSSSSPSDKSLSVTVPVDIDIALDDKLGREFADELNQWLSAHNRETYSVGVVLRNPEKSKHLETATMRVNNYWIDFVNLRAEEYTSDSRIPDLMRIGTAEEDALRRDLTINSLFYNINEGVVEDMTGQGLDDLRRGVVATPLPPLTTLLDDPLRVLRSVRFAARLRFGMADPLRKAAADSRVKIALEQKVSRERVGSEIDLMLKSRDPVRAMRLLVNLGLIETVFLPPEKKIAVACEGSFNGVFHEGLALLGTTHDHLCDCKVNPPSWCEAERALEAGAVNGAGKEETRVLMEDENTRRLLWYAAFLKPLRDCTALNDKEIEPETRKQPRKANRSVVLTLLVDGLKRPIREAESVEKIMKAADGFTSLVATGSDVSALLILLSGAHVLNVRGNLSEGERQGKTLCTMDNRTVDPDREDDPVWKHCMEFRQNCADVLRKIEPLWRAAFILSLCEQLTSWKNQEIEYTCGGNMVLEAPEEVVSGITKNYDIFAAAMMQLGLIGIWNQQPLLNGNEIKKSVLPQIPSGPVFRDVMDVQILWMTSHPGGSREKLVEHLRQVFQEYV